MAWIRWRGLNAHLMTTEQRQGHSVQRYLVSLGGSYSVSASQRAAIESNYPDVVVDWAAIDEALAAGPPGARPLSAPEWDAVHIEHQLRIWAEQAPDLLPSEREAFVRTAQALQLWRARRDGAPPKPSDSS